MKKGKKVIIIPGILLAVLAVVIGRFMIKPNPQKLAQEILDNLKTVESFNAERTFSIRILGDYE